jgi:hypothetical protein
VAIPRGNFLVSRTSRSHVARLRAAATAVLAITLVWCGSTIAFANPSSPDREVDGATPLRVQTPSVERLPAASERPSPVAPSPDWTIQVDTTGYQDELNQCLWVRMDFIDVVPIVGKHNYCGGDIVLTMTLGQTVHLAGLGLDGTYIVTGDRQVFSGEQATVATANLTADVILQTCYWNKSQGMRFVTLSLLPEVQRVLVGVS